MWLVEQLRTHPELAVFLVLALGYGLGRIRLGSFQVGTVIGVLIAGILVGQLRITVADELKDTFFLLFLFSIGFKTGPQFFSGLRSGGLAQAGVTVVVCASALIAALLTAKLFGFDRGIASGLLAGSMTESAALGTATDAIAKLSLPPEMRQQLAADSTVAFAVTYVVGMIAVTWLLSRLGPWLMRVDLAESCRQLEQQLGIDRTDPDVVSAHAEFSMRAYEIGAGYAGRTVSELEAAFGAYRVYVERIRHGEDMGEEITEPSPGDVLRERDRVVLSGRSEALVGEQNPLRECEVDDHDLLDIPTVQVDIVVTHKAALRKPLRELATLAASRGVFLHSLARGGDDLPFSLLTMLQRGDVVTLSGAKEHIERAAQDIGQAQWHSEATNVVSVSLAILIGGLIGLPALSIGRLDIGLSMFVGVLLGGLVLGWLCSVKPRLGGVPPAALWFFDSVGLAGFLAVVGMNAGPQFVQGVTQSGVALILAALIVVASAHIVGVLVGYYIFKLHPGVLLGVCAGAGTAAPALAAVQEVAGSKVPTLGYGVGYALGNVLLALWGSIVVLLLA